MTTLTWHDFERQIIEAAGKEIKERGIASTTVACREQCPGGRRCYCNGKIRHSLHICADSRCICHSRARYEGRVGEAYRQGKYED